MSNEGLLVKTWGMFTTNPYRMLYTTTSSGRLMYWPLTAVNSTINTNTSITTGKAIPSLYKGLMSKRVLGCDVYVGRICFITNVACVSIPSRVSCGKPGASHLNSVQCVSSAFYHDASHIWRKFTGPAMRLDTFLTLK